VGKVEVKDDGTFVMSDLPSGPYTITARGSYSNRRAEGSVEGVQPSPPDRVEKIYVVVDRKKE
jgi:hypothetical protein